MEAETVRDLGQGGDVSAAMMELHPLVYERYWQKKLEAQAQEGFSGNIWTKGKTKKV
jgi:hypothetical protein